MNFDDGPRVYDEDIPEHAEEFHDEIADWYSQRKKGSYEFKIQLPAILNLLGDLQGKRLIDIGCGPGVYSLELAKRGADVLGVDISQKMLDKARNNAETANVKLTLRKSYAHSLPSKDGSFDIAALILMNLDTEVLEEVARILKSGGLLLFSDTHPMIESKGRWEGKGIGASRVVEDYFSQDKKEWRIQPNLGRTITLRYHKRTIEQSVNMIADAGFRILRIVEPKPGEDVRKSDPVHYDKCSRIPYFIIYLAQKSL
ncbi:MAG: methyltransferase domain-containing protein [Candidatus Bathyarchaeota archaeon]|nr:methyltransferase domain-containing protein [Candidatus Bathyarchaeota archaeon]